MKRSRLLVVLVAVLAAVVGVLLLAEKRTSEPDVAGVPRAADAASPTAEGAHLAGRGAEADTSPPADGPPETAEAAEAAEGRLLLDILVEADEPAILREARVVLMFEGADLFREDVYVVLGVDGRARVDLQGMIAELHTTHLVLAVEHPRCLPLREALPIPRPLPEGGMLELRARLRPALVVSGRVLVTHGQPWYEVPVAIFPVSRIPRRGEEGADHCWLDPVEETRTRRDGTYDLRVAALGSYVVATGDSDWMESFRALPDATLVEVRGPETHVRDLALRDGVTIAGRLLLNDHPFPYGDAWVHACLEGKPFSVGLEVGYGDVRWGEYGLVPAAQCDRVEDAGRFCVESLAPGRWLLTVSRPGDLGIDPSLLEACAVTVDAPADAAKIRLYGVVVDVRVVDASGPVAGATVTVDADDWDPEVQTSREGVARFLLRPDHPYVVRASAEGHREAAVTHTTPPERRAATWELQLPVADDRGVVAVHVRGPSGDPVPEARVTIDIREMREARQGKTDGKGVFTCEDVPAGSGWLRVEPHDVRGGHFAYLLSAGRPLAVEAGETATCSVVLVAGGLVRFEVRDPAGRLVPAACTLRDDQGDEPPVLFVARTPMRWLEGDRLHAEAPSLTASALPPGRYSATIQPEGGEARTVMVEVEAGKTATVALTIGR